MTRTFGTLEYDDDGECNFKPGQYITPGRQGLTVGYPTLQAMEEVLAMTSKQLEDAYGRRITSFKNN